MVTKKKVLSNYHNIYIILPCDYNILKDKIIIKQYYKIFKPKYNFNCLFFFSNHNCGLQFLGWGSYIIYCFKIMNCNILCAVQCLIYMMCTNNKLLMMQDQFLNEKLLQHCTLQQNSYSVPNHTKHHMGKDDFV